MSEWAAGPGQVWVCCACGRYGKDRMTLNDESCFLKAILCFEDSLQYVEGDRGRVNYAEAIDADPN